MVLVFFFFSQIRAERAEAVIYFFLSVISASLPAAECACLWHGARSGTQRVASFIPSLQKGGR